MTSRAEFTPISEIARKQVLITCLRRIENRAEIMQTDALRGAVPNHVRACDANDIRMLAQMALGCVEADGHA